MSENTDQTKAGTPEFDFSRYPADSLFHERRTGRDRRDEKTPAAGPEQLPKSDAHPERRAKKDRRRRIDPTTFDKQYTDDEMEFMNAMQRFKERSGKSFPSYREVLKVMVELGYRLVIVDPDPGPADPDFAEPVLLQESTIDA
jgi:hypothetical protein